MSYSSRYSDADREPRYSLRMGFLCFGFSKRVIDWDYLIAKAGMILMTSGSPHVILIS